MRARTVLLLGLAGALVIPFPLASAIGYAMYRSAVHRVPSKILTYHQDPEIAQMISAHESLIDREAEGKRLLIEAFKKSPPSISVKTIILEKPLEPGPPVEYIYDLWKYG